MTEGDTPSSRDVKLQLASFADSLARVYTGGGPGKQELSRLAPSLRRTVRPADCGVVSIPALDGEILFQDSLYHLGPLLQLLPQKGCEQESSLLIGVTLLRISVTSAQALQYPQNGCFLPANHFLNKTACSQ